MTERFILTEQFNGLQGVAFVKDECADVDTYYTVDGAVDLLNELADENKQLKKQLDETIDGLYKQITSSENAFEGLMKENKELRDACKNYDWYKLYNQLRNENEKLKKALWCIRKRYGYTIEEFVEDLKDNGTDLTKVDLE